MLSSLKRMIWYKLWIFFTHPFFRKLQVCCLNPLYQHSYFMWKRLTFVYFWILCVSFHAQNTKRILLLHYKRQRHDIMDRCCIILITVRMCCPNPLGFRQHIFISKVSWTDTNCPKGITLSGIDVATFSQKNDLI